MAIDGVNSQNEVRKPVVGGGASPQNAEAAPANVDLKDAKAKTSEAAFEKSGLSISKEDVKQDQDGIRTSAATKERVAETYNEYAKKIYNTCAGAPPELKAIAQQYIAELPKSSRRADLQAYKAQCETKLEGFRGAVRDAGLGQYLQAMELSNEVRHGLTSTQLEQSTKDIKNTIVDAKEAVVERVDENTTEIKSSIHKAEVNIKKNTNRQVGYAVRNINRNTRAAVAQGTADNLQNLRAAVGLTPDNQKAVGKAQRFTDGTSIDYENTVNGHTTAETDRGVSENLKNQRALHGVDEKNKPLKPGTTAKTTDGETIKQEDTTLGRVDAKTKEIKEHVSKKTDEVKKHVSKESEKTRLNAQQLEVLQSKRQAISDMLGHEERDGMRYWGSALPNTYRDATVKWLGASADRVFADQELSFKKKEEALDELNRMVDEELIISDADRAEFEGKYFKDTREHRHL